MSADGYYAMKRAARTFPAKYGGRCVSCDERINVGDECRYDEDDNFVHANCDAAIGGEPTTETCPRCFLAVAVNGECGCES